ncbi:MAG: RsmB/NOP family class I SAM-dependent RNA methyltransferase [Holosporales bacterium]|jgi:16S rRNA (cytosine967-C5)-methyltransferase|nr:RsmB/NOP family class I SAM-dependent RNA methyltransferase [Holosporales bacterium]
MTPIFLERGLTLLSNKVKEELYPADIAFREFCKEKNLGSKNRRELSQYFFEFLRKYWFYYWKNGNTENIEEMVKVFLKEKYLNESAPIWAKANLSPEIWEEFENSFPANKEILQEIQNKQAYTDIRVNTFAGFQKSFVARQLCADGFVVDELPYGAGLRLQQRFDFSRNALYRAGAFEIQDFGSQIVSNLCCQKYNNTDINSVLDYCAGGGGKSLAILNNLNSLEKIVLTDIDQKRFNSAKHRFERIQKFSEKKSFFEKKIEKNVFFSEINEINGQFDIVLVDAPCSGIGTLRRNPWLTINLNNREKINELHYIQCEILKKAAFFVKKEGFLIYITCSILKKENEDVAHKFLLNFPEFKSVDISDCWQHSFSQKLLLKLQPSRPFLRLWPSIFDSDGFFMAIFQNEN